MAKRVGLDPNYEWITIDDFRPGIVQRRGVNHTSAFTLNSLGPLGSCHRDVPGSAVTTYGCLATPEGALGPGPGPFSGASPAPTLGLTAPYGPITILGLQVVLNTTRQTYAQGGLTLPGTARPEEVFLLLYSPNNNNTSSKLQLQRWQHELAVPAWQVCYQAFPLSTLGVLSGQRMPITRINNTAPYITAGTPTICFVDPLSTKVLAFPDPAAPGVTGTRQLSTDIVHDLIAHQGRIIELVELPSQFGSGTTFLESNEQLNFTDPPNSPLMGSQTEVFVPEYPVGYGVIDDVSSGELFAVKHDHGAVLISGDMNNPSVNFLPNVAPTYGMGSIGDATRAGYVYLTPFGAFAWTGGDSSKLLSQQLEDNFINFNNFASPITDPLSPQYCVQAWGNYVVFSNNWLYDTITESWWVLGPDDVASPGVSANPNQWFARGWGQTLWSTVGSYATDGDSTTSGLIRQYDLHQPSQTWQWTSNPIEMENPESYKDIREVVIEASYSGGTSNSITVQFLDANDGSPASGLVTFNLTARKYNVLRANVSVSSPYVFVVIKGISGGLGAAAPVLNAIHIGHKPTTMVVAG